MKNFEHYKDVFMRCKGRNLELSMNFKEVLENCEVVENVD